MCRGGLAALALAALLVAGPSPPAAAHGGPPLRIGVTPAADQRALGRLVLSHLRDGVGYAVDWRAFPDERSQAEAFAAGRLDILIGCADGRPAAIPEIVPLPFLTGRPAPCERLGAAVSPRVLEDVRFTILPRELVKLFNALAPADLEAVAAAERTGGERAAAAAARARLAGKRFP